MRVRNRLLLIAVPLVAMLLVSQGAFAAGGGEQGGASSGPAATVTYKTYHTNVQSTDVEAYNASPTAAYIASKTGVTVKALPTKDNATELVLDLASGSLPDILAVWAFTGYLEQLDVVTKAARESQLADLGPSLKKYGSVVSQLIKPEKLNAFLRDAVVYNPAYSGKTYLLPTNYSSLSPSLDGTGIYIRGDVARALNVSTPDARLSTPDDLYNLLKKIKDAGFKNTNGIPVWPIGIIGGDWDFVVDELLRPFDWGGVIRIEPQNGQLKHFMETDYAWQSVQFLRRLINDGLMDPEALTHKYEVGSEKIAQGYYAVLPFSGYYVWPRNSPYMRTLVEGHPDMQYLPLGNMQTHLGNHKFVINGTGDYSIAIAASAKANTDAVVRVINFMSTKEGRATANLGVLGQTWNWNSKGFAQLTPEAYTQVTSGKGFSDEWGTGAQLGILTVKGIDDPQLNPFGWNGTDPTYQSSTEKAAFYDKMLNGVMPDRTVDKRLGIDFLLNAYPNKDKVSPLLVVPKIDEILFQAALVKTEAEARSILQNFVDTMRKNGLTDYIQYLQKEYDKDPKKYSTYMSTNL